MSETQNEQMFLELGGDGQGTTEIESCCMNCYKTASLHEHFLINNRKIIIE